MTQLPPLIKCSVIAMALVLSACASTNTAQNTRSVGADQSGIPLQDTQNDFELLLKRLESQPDRVNASMSAAPHQSLITDPQKGARKTAHNGEIKSRLLQQYSHWKGVRYRLGGDTHKGIDCSAFVQRTFLDQFGIALPRSTAEQRGLGERIPRNQLRSGDLVLFKSGSTGRHVGIYIGNNQFVHASERKGVIISSLDNPYWKPRYSEARRILASNG